MASLRYLLPLLLLLLNLFVQFITADSNLTFNFENFGKESNFESQLAMFGDATVINSTTSIQITGSRVSSPGSVLYKKSVNRNSGQRISSFSSQFVFSMSRGKGNAFAFVIIPVASPSIAFNAGNLKNTKSKSLAIEFGDFSVKVSNVNSSTSLVLNSGEKFQSWIDYESSFRTLEVRLSKSGGNRPILPLLLCHIDLSKMWEEEDVIVGLISLNSSREINLYSWSFQSKTIPKWMHSEPVNPEDLVVKGREEIKGSNRSNCFRRIVAALIFGSGCGAVVAFLLMFLWTVFGNWWRPIGQDDFAVDGKEFDYQKFGICAGKKATEGGMK